MYVEHATMVGQGSKRDAAPCVEGMEAGGSCVGRRCCPCKQAHQLSPSRRSSCAVDLLIKTKRKGGIETTSQE